MCKIILIILAFALTGCFTMLRHPDVVSESVQTEGGELQQSQQCTDCHSGLHRANYYFWYPQDSFWMRTPFYSHSYYSRWRHYTVYPWWGDRVYYPARSHRDRAVKERRTPGRRAELSGEIRKNQSVGSCPSSSATQRCGSVERITMPRGSVDLTVTEQSTTEQKQEITTTKAQNADTEKKRGCRRKGME